jgi:hypothetical protein
MVWLALAGNTGFVSAFPSGFPRLCSSYWIAYIVRVVYSIVAITDGGFVHQSKTLHVRLLNLTL